MIYLDCAATCPIDPEVAEVVRFYMEVEFGNSGSRTHAFGARAKQAVEKARRQVAEVAAVSSDEVIFTSGATESDNLAILGLAEEGERTGRKHLISTQIEHKAVLEPLLHLQRSRGFELTLVPPNQDGVIAAEGVRAALRDDTLLVSVMHVNNETGAVQPIEAVAEVLSGHHAYFHVDAAQSFGKVSGLRNTRIDLCSVSGHKMGAPKGVGALVMRRRRWSLPPIAPLMYGGGQEHGRRPGTLPVSLIAGLGQAAELHRVRGRELGQRRRDVSEVVRHHLSGRGHKLIGRESTQCDFILSFCHATLDAEAFVLRHADMIAVSNGSACTSDKREPSHVLRAIGLAPSEIDRSIRVSWSHMTDQEVVAQALETV